MASKRFFPLGQVDEATRSVRVIASTSNPVNGVYLDEDGVPQPRLEALTSWDLGRFTANPVVLWQHKDSKPAIGLARDAEQTAEGLQLTIHFAAASDSAEAEEAYRKVKAGLVRGVSVGFAYGTEEKRDGISYFANNVLEEVSLVTIPADPEAVLPPQDDSLTEEERSRKKASRAASELAKHRYARGARVDSGDDEFVVHLDNASPLDRFERTQVGGLRIPARIARTGVLTYKLADGSTRRELRLPEEFKADSIATLAHAPVTDIEHHRSLISTSNWKHATLGHVDNVRVDGTFLLADVLLNDATTIADVENGRLKDISAGYRCRLERTSGVWNGERYDAIQRDIKYNHVAVLPPGRGRAGTDVGLRLDSDDEVVVEEHAMEPNRTLIKLDGKDFEYGSQQHVGYLETRVDAKDVELKQAKKERDELQARLDASEAAAKKAKGDAEKEAEKEKEERAKKAKASRALRRQAKKAIRALEDELEKEEEEEEKSDALEDELDDLTDREVMVRVIRADSKDFDDRGKSDDYVLARFDCSIEKATERSKEKAKVRTDSVDDVVRKIEAGKRTSAPSEDAELKAREEMIKRGREAYKQPLRIGA